MAMIVVGSYLDSKEKEQCDEVIFIEGELSMDIRYVKSYNNGITYVYLCDGTEMKVFTHRIIKIVDKE